MLRRVAIAGRGHGLVAARPIAAGTPLITERPVVFAPDERAAVPQLFKWMMASTANAQQAEALYPQAWADLTPPDAERYAQFGATPERQQQMLPMLRLRLNAFEVHTVDLEGAAPSSAEYHRRLATLKPQQSRTLLFPTISHINHDCSPNASLSITATAPLMSAASPVSVVAIADIPEGGEVTICYMDVNGVAPGERRGALKEHYGFTCECPRCKAAAATPARGGALGMRRFRTDELLVQRAPDAAGAAAGDAAGAAAGAAASSVSGDDAASAAKRRGRRLAAMESALWALDRVHAFDYTLVSRADPGKALRVEETGFCGADGALRQAEGYAALGVCHHRMAAAREEVLRQAAAFLATGGAGAGNGAAGAATGAPPISHDAPPPAAGGSSMGWDEFEEDTAVAQAAAAAVPRARTDTGSVLERSAELLAQQAEAAFAVHPAGSIWIRRACLVPYYRLLHASRAMQLAAGGEAGAATAAADRAFRAAVQAAPWYAAAKAVEARFPAASLDGLQVGVDERVA